MIPCFKKPCDYILQVLKRDTIATQKIKSVVSMLPPLILHILKNQFQREKEICKKIGVRWRGPKLRYGVSKNAS